MLFVILLSDKGDFIISKKKSSHFRFFISSCMERFKSTFKRRQCIDLWAERRDDAFVLYANIRAQDTSWTAVNTSKHCSVDFLKFSMPDYICTL